MDFSKEMIASHDRIMRLFEELSKTQKTYFVDERTRNKATYSLDLSIVLFLLINPGRAFTAIVPESTSVTFTKEQVQDFVHQLKNNIHKLLNEKTGWGKNELMIKLEKLIDETQRFYISSLVTNTDNESPF